MPSAAGVLNPLGYEAKMETLDPCRHVPVETPRLLGLALSKCPSKLAHVVSGIRGPSVSLWVLVHKFLASLGPRGLVFDFR